MEAKHDAFISYNHRADQKLAKALEQGMEKLAKPLLALRAIDVFRDETGLAANPDLWAGIVDHLTGTRWLILLACPEWAGSLWCGREALWWLDHRSTDSMLIAVIGGEIAWDRARGDFDWTVTTALSKELSGRFHQEPLYVDLRWAREHDDLTLSNISFRDAVLSLSATVRGIRKDELDGEDVRQQRRAVKVAYSAAATFAVLTLIAAGLGVGFYIQRNVATERLAQTQISQSRFLADRAVTSRDENPTDSVLLALAGLPDKSAGIDRPAVPESERAIFDAFSVLREHAVLEHQGGVVSATFSPDGKMVATASVDRTVRLWDAASGKALETLRHDDELLGAAFSPDGRTIVSRSKDMTVRIWDVGSHAPKHILNHKNGQVRAAVFSADGTRIVTGSTDGTARVWDAATGKHLLPLEGHTGELWSAVFSPDGNTIMTASEDKTIRLWDAVSGRGLGVLEGHEAGILAAAYSPDGTRIVSGSYDRTARIWDVASRKELWALKEHDDKVLDFAISPDSTKVVTAAGGGIRLWDMASGELVHRFRDHEIPVLSVAFSSDSTKVISTSRSTAHIWDAASGEEIATLKAHQGWIDSAFFSPDNSRIVTASSDRTARLWRLDAALEPTILGQEKSAVSMAASPKGPELAVGLADNSVALWKDLGGKDVMLLRGHEGKVHRAIFSPDGRSLITLGQDKAPRLWSTASAKQLAILSGHEDEVTGAVVSPDSDTIATVSNDKTARLWSAASGKALAVLQGHKYEVHTAMFSPDSSRIVTLSHGDSARIWDRAAPGQPVILRLSEPIVNDVAFTRDGKRVITVSAEGQFSEVIIRAWDAASGKQLQTFKAPPIDRGFKLWPDGARTMSWTLSDHMITLHMWDLATGKELMSFTSRVAPRIVFNADETSGLLLMGDEPAQLWDAASQKATRSFQQKNRFEAAVFSADGTRMVSLSDGTVRVWRMLPKTQELVDYAKRTVPRCLSRQQREQANLAPEPPVWCITGPGLEAEQDPNRWQPKWPYHTQAWRDWLLATRKGSAAALPAAD